MHVVCIHVASAFYQPSKKSCGGEMMKRAVAFLGLLAAVPAHGFFVPSIPKTRAIKPWTTFAPRHGQFIACRPAPSGADRSRSQRAAFRSLIMGNDGPDVLKTVGAVVILLATVGGSALPFLSLAPETSGPKTVRVVDEEGNTSERGSMTAMTRAEIQKKLAQVPVFFLRDPNGGVHVDGGEGLFFMNPADAQAKIAGMTGVDGVKVSATTLDDVWYPLIKKKGQNKKSVAAEAAVNSDLSARYRIIPRVDQVSQASGTDGWNSVGDKDGVPVWAANSLAFQAGSRYKTPLFTNMDDLMTSWQRLKTEAGSKSEAPVVQVSSIGAIVEIMESGGGDNRNLEFFADMDSIEQAEKLL